MFQQEKEQKNVDRNASLRITNDVRERMEAKTKIKWAKFTYVGGQTKFINKLFKTSSLKVSFKADTIQKLLAQNKKTNNNKFNKCGVNQLTCQDCKRKYIRQTGRP